MLDATNEKARGFIADILSDTKASPTPAAVVNPAAVATPPAAPAAVVDPAAAVAPPPAAASEEPPKPKKTRKADPAPEPVDYERLAATTAKAVAEAVRPAPEAAPAPMPPNEVRRIQYLSRLESLYPEKYEGVSQKYERSFRAVEDYQRRWEKENPDETFDAGAAEHSDFLEKHAVDWADEDYAEAVAEEKSDLVRRQTRAEYEERDRRREAEPKAREKGRGYADKVVEGLAPEMKDIITGELTPEVFGKAEDADPIKGPIIARAADFAARITAETAKLYEGVVNYNAANPLHKQINDFAMTKEKEMLALPRSQQIDGEGRAFLSSVEYYKLAPKDRARAWTLQADDLAFLATQEIVSDAKKVIEREEARANKLRVKWGVVDQKAAAPAAAAVAPPAAPTVAKPVSPSGGTDPKMAGVKGDSATEHSTRWGSFQKTFLGV